MILLSAVVSANGQINALPAELFLSKGEDTFLQLYSF